MLISLRDVKLIYLTAYSPDCNPMEKAFSFLKAYIHRRGANFRAIAERGSEEDVRLFLYEALGQITAEHVRGWFHHSGYI